MRIRADRVRGRRSPSAVGTKRAVRSRLTKGSEQRGASREGRADRGEQRGASREARAERGHSRADLGGETEQDGKRKHGPETVRKPPRCQSEQATRQSTCHDGDRGREVRGVANNGRTARGGEVENGDNDVGRHGGRQRRGKGRKIQGARKVGERAGERGQGLQTRKKGRSAPDSPTAAVGADHRYIASFGRFCFK